MKGPLENVFYNQADPRLLELYVRTAQIDKIKYGDEADLNERIQVQHLQLAYRLPLEVLPDPRVVIEDEKDFVKLEKQQALLIKKKEEQKLAKEAQRIAKKQQLEEKKKTIALGD